MDYNASLVEERTPSLQFENEEQFKNFLSYTVLRKKGFATYADELEDYYLNLDKTEAELETLAAIDVVHKIIFIASELPSKLMSAVGEEKQRLTDLFSMLLRHELLHSLLEHRRRTIIDIAKSFKFDYEHLTREQFQKIQEVYHQASAFGVTISNFSGDLDLSRYYLAKKDIDICHGLGALVLADHPNWTTYSFEQLLKASTEFNKRIMHMMMPIIYGEFDANGQVVVKREEDSEFNTTTKIPVEFLCGFRLPTEDDMKGLTKYRVDTWLDVGDNENNIDTTGFAPYWVGTWASTANVTELKPISIVIRVMYLSNFKQAQPGSTVSINKQKAIVLNDHEVIINEIGETEFNTLSHGEENGTYRFSIAYFYLKDWYENLIRGKIK